MRQDDDSDPQAPHEINRPDQIDLNSSSIEELQSLFSAFPGFSKEIVRCRPYASAEHLFSTETIANSAEWNLPFVTLVERAFVETSTPREHSRKTLYELPTGGRLEAIMYDDAEPRLALIHPLNLELISAAGSPKNPEDIAPETVRLFGHSPSEFLRATPESRQSAWHLLHDAAAQEAAALWRSCPPELDEVDLWEQIARLSRTLNVVQVLNRPARSETTRLPRTDWDWVTDGCTGAPDSTWVECCDEHDLCYSLKGQRDSGRLDCDIEFRECLRAKGHSVVGSLYYTLVRAFAGTDGTRRGEQIVPEVGIVTFQPGVTAHGRCEYWFELQSISYLREDVGIENWDLGFGLGPTRMSFSRNVSMGYRETRTFGDAPFVIKNGSLESCGTTVREQLYVRIGTTGIGKLFFFDVTCDGRQVDYQLWMPIQRGSNARLKLKVRMKSYCGPQLPTGGQQG